MNLTVIRHGSAQTHAARDRERALTAVGRDEARQVGVDVSKVAPPPELIISSPFVRAVQTAELVAAAIGYSGTIEIDRGLRPDCSASDVVARLATLTGLSSVMLVAHEPILSSLCEHILGISFGEGLRRAEAVGMTWAGPDVHHVGAAKLLWRIVPALMFREV